jgi:hypothetical protein
MWNCFDIVIYKTTKIIDAVSLFIGIYTLSKI